MTEYNPHMRHIIKSKSTPPSQILEVNYIVRSCYVLPKGIDLEKEGVEWSIVDTDISRQLHIIDKKQEGAVKKVVDESLFWNGVEDKRFTSVIYSKGTPLFNANLDSLKGSIQLICDDEDEEKEEEGQRREIFFLFLEGKPLEWSLEGKMRRATVEDVEKWGGELQQGTFISVVNDKFSLEPLRRYFITQTELDAITSLEPSRDLTYKWEEGSRHCLVSSVDAAHFGPILGCDFVYCEELEFPTDDIYVESFP